MSISKTITITCRSTTLTVGDLRTFVEDTSAAHDDAIVNVKVVNGDRPGETGYSSMSVTIGT